MWNPHELSIRDNFKYTENGARALPNSDKNEEVNHAITTVILVREQHFCPESLWHEQVWKCLTKMEFFFAKQREHL